METKDLYKSLSRETLEVLAIIQEKINKLEFEEMLDFLVQQIIETLKVERCCIFRVSEESEKAVLVVGEPKDGHSLGMSFSFKDLDALKEVAETKSYILIDDFRQDSRTRHSRELARSKDINAALLVPFLTKEGVVWVIVIDATGSKKSFSQEELYFCLALSNSVSPLLERDIIHQEREERKTLMILGEAAAEVADRMRNPLAVIGGLARRLEKKIQDEECKGYVKRIAEEVADLESRINSLLKFVRPKNKEGAVLTDINEVIKEAERMAGDLIKNRKIKMETELDLRIPPVFVNTAEIRDAFLDILRNGVEAMDEGTITIKSKCEEKQARISIANTGCIEEGIINHIMDPFFTTKPGSLGLGLSSAVSTIRTYGGEVKVKNNRYTNETIFIIRIPYPQQP